MVCCNRNWGPARLWKKPVDAGSEAPSLQKLFRFNDLSQHAGKRTPDDRTRCPDNFALAFGFKSKAMDLILSLRI